MKKILIISLLLFIISIGCVSASDVDSDVISLNATDDGAISAGAGTFSELQNKINSAGQGSTINLDKDYTYNDGFDTSGIQISKALTINGNDYTIDGKGLSRIFDIEASNVNLKGLTLINGYCEDDKGGAILWNGDSGSIVESTLEYNAALAGGAIYWHGTNGEVDHCTFNRNNATEEYGYGGAILIDGECLSITASDFYKNYALDEGDGGALSVDAEGVTVDSCNFERNYANNAGGAIYWSGDDGLLTACTFLHDYATLGGAIVHTGFDSIVSESSFEECYALEGGAISINYCNLRIPDCIFNDNYAEYRGGAIKIDSYGAASVINSIFTNNRVTKSTGSNHGGAIYSVSEEGIEVRNSYFENNEVPYLGSAIFLNNDGEDIIENCTFKNNTGNYGAINAENTKVTIKDSKFSDNNGNNGAADVIMNSDDSSIANCDFKNSYGGGNGGSINWAGNNGQLSDSTFTNCIAAVLSSAGAVYWSGNNGEISKSEFKNNKAFDSGAIRLYGDDVTVKDSKFTNNTASLNGGAIDIDGINDKIINCQFDKNSALNGGAIKVSGDKATVEKSTFTQNNAANGGAINWGGNDGNLINSNFVKNTATDIGGALYWFGNDGTIKYDIFENNKTKLHNDIAIEGNNVVVIPLSIKIDAPDVTKNYGGSESLQITLTENKKPIANANVLISINKGNYTKTTDANGKASLALNLNSGIYNAVISYKEVSTTSKVTINKLSTSLKLTASQSADKTATLTATVNPSAAAGSVVFNINNKDYTATISNGKATTTVKNLDYKTYDVKATYAGSTNYKSSQASSKVTIEEKKLIIDAPDVTKYYGGSERLTVRISDSTGKALANKQVNININGQPYTRTTDSSGKTSIALNLNSGTYKVPVECDGVKAESTVTIKSTVSGKDITKMFRNDTQYYATFVDTQGNLLKNTKVKFNINGVFYERTTNDQGSAKMNINLNPKKYVITATNPSSGEQYTNVVTVNSLFTENYDLTKYYRNASAYSLRLLGPDGKPVKAGQSVVFNINGVFYTRNSNDDGYVRMNINLQPGTYTITAEYNGLRASNTIKVLNVLTGKDVNMEYRDGSKYEAKLLDGQGKPYAGQTIRLNINGVFYDRVTDANGIARLNLNLQPGTYIITASYNGLNAANKVVIRSSSMITHKSYGFTVEVPKDAKCEDAFVVNTGSCIVRYSNGQSAHISEHSDTYQSNVGFYMNYGRYLNTGSYGNWIILNNPSKSSTDEAYVLICNSNPVYAISSNDLSIAKQLAGSLKIVPGCVPDNADSGESGEIDEDMVEYDCGHFHVVLPQSATIELIKDEGNAAVFEVTYDGNTYQITEDSTYSKNSYLNIITSNGGSIIDTYGGWTLATINSRAYFAYCENSGITFGVMGNQRDIVESIASSMTF